MVVKKKSAGSKRKRAHKSKDVPDIVIKDDHRLAHEDLFTFGLRSMMTYSKATNEDRAVPDLVDGLKPSMRRLLWAALKHTGRGSQVKSAKILGATLGSYHPHAPEGLYGALQTMVNSEFPTFKGTGNFGTLTDPAAAFRYTECALSRYGESFLQKDYLDVSPIINNFDGSTVEPLTLPALLPNVFLNRTTGIGVGLTTSIPSFDAKDLLAVCSSILRSEDVVDEKYLVKNLRFRSTWGGRVVQDKANKAAIKEFFETGRGTVRWESVFTENRDKKVIVMTGFAMDLNYESFVAKVRDIPQVSCTDEQKGKALHITIKPSTNFVEFDKVFAKIRALATTKVSYRLNVTVRDFETKDTYGVKFLQGSFLSLLVLWLKQRVRLEIRALDLMIKNQAKDVAYTKLLIRAADCIDLIVKAIRAKDPEAALMKGMKITKEEANQIRDLQIRQLERLSQDKLKTRLAAQREHLKVLEARRKKPAKTVASWFEGLKFETHDKRWKNQEQTYLLSGLKAVSPAVDEEVQGQGQVQPTGEATQ